MQVYGSESLSIALVHAQAGTTASNHGDFSASEQALQAALELYESRLGRSHGAAISALNNLGVLYVRAGDLERAEQVFRELLARSEQKYGREHRTVAGHYQNLGAVLGRQGRFDDALPLHRKAAEIYSVVLSEDHFFRAYPLISIAYAELQLQDFPAAEQAARRALALLAEADDGPYPTAVATCLAGLALQRQGREEEGEALLVEARAKFSGLALDPNYRSLCGL